MYTEVYKEYTKCILKVYKDYSEVYKEYTKLF